MTITDIAQLLLDAADVIERTGLTKEAYWSPLRVNDDGTFPNVSLPPEEFNKPSDECAHCSIGAIYEASPDVQYMGFDHYESPLQELARTIDPDYDPGDDYLHQKYFDIVTRFNDAPERTPVEVIDVFRRTAARLLATPEA